MTALIRIAETLRRSSDEQIADLLARHSISPSNFKDFFDLANALTQPKVISAKIAALPRRLAEQLSKLIRGGEIDQASQQDLEHLLLITLQQESTDKTSATAFQHTLEAFSALTESKKSQSPLAEISSPSAPDQREIDRDAGLNAFSLLQALTELVFDIEQRYVKVIAKTSAGLPDLRRLSAHLGHPVEYIRDCFVVAERLGLIEHDDQRWRLAEGAANWLQVSASEQWALAASSWSESLGFTSEFDRQQFASKIRSSESRIDQLLLEEFPLAVGNQLNLLQKTLESARVTFENTQKITSDIDELIGDPQFRENLRRLIDGLSNLLSSGEQLEYNLRIAQTLDTMTQELAKQKVLTISRPSLNPKQMQLYPQVIVQQPPTSEK